MTEESKKELVSGKLYVDQRSFEFNQGLRVMKMKFPKFEDTNPYFQEQMESLKIKDIWDEIETLRFDEIATMSNLEDRRVVFKYYGIERLFKETNPTLIDTQTLRKTTSWVTQEGDLKTFEYDDTYELYAIDKKFLNPPTEDTDNSVIETCYLVRCKCTSTDREYLIWVEPRSIFSANTGGTGRDGGRFDFDAENLDTKIVNAISSIAWTITTDLPEGEIEEIIRQGDCIIIYPKNTWDGKKLNRPRHLCEQEYRELLTLES